MQLNGNEMIQIALYRGFADHWLISSCFLCLERIACLHSNLLNSRYLALKQTVNADQLFRQTLADTERFHSLVLKMNAIHEFIIQKTEHQPAYLDEEELHGERR